MASFQSISQDALTETWAHSNDYRPRYGETRWDPVANKMYRFARLVDQDGAVGEVVYPAQATEALDTYSVTTDYTGGSAVSARVTGVLLGTVDISEKPGCWIQVPFPGTKCAMVRTVAGVAAGEGLIGHTVDGEADTMAAGEEHLVFAFAMADATTINSQDACIAEFV